MRAAIALVLIATTSVAQAQPGAGDPPPSDPSPAPDPTPAPDPSPYPPPPYPTPLPPPPPVQPVQPVPAPYNYQPMAIQLTAEEHSLLQRGEISDGAHVGGGLANVFLGFGIGQAIQGRWSEKGWLFTVGGAASITAIIVGAVSTIEGGGENGEGVLLFIGGYIGFLVFHVWGAVDAFIEPPKHNRRVRELRARLGIPSPYWGRVMPYVQPSRDHGGGTAGLVFRF